MRRAERYRDGERASLAEHTVHAYRPAVEFDQFLHERQADARAFVRPTAAVLDAMEALEHARQFVGWDAHAGVAHRQARLAVSGWRRTSISPVRVNLNALLKG